jgi:hypothetical protein
MQTEADVQTKQLASLQAVQTKEPELLKTKYFCGHKFRHELLYKYCPALQVRHLLSLSTQVKQAV